MGSDQAALNAVLRVEAGFCGGSLVCSSGKLQVLQAGAVTNPSESFLQRGRSLHLFIHLFLYWPLVNMTPFYMFTEYILNRYSTEQSEKGHVRRIMWPLHFKSDAKFNKERSV